MCTDPSSQRDRDNIRCIVFAVVAKLFVQWATGELYAGRDQPLSRFEQLVANGEVRSPSARKRSKVKNKLPSSRSEFAAVRRDRARQLEAKGWRSSAPSDRVRRRPSLETPVNVS